MNGPQDIAIALAWPATLCKQAGAWYDGLMHKMNINRNGYYQVGHAALVLLKRDAQTAQYFDLGRYHAPAGMARVRSAETDHELRIHTPLTWRPDLDVPVNICSLLEEVANNRACHGDGVMHWSAVAVEVEHALAKAKAMQARVFIPYGPFVLGGSNCSRFVNTAIRAGRPQPLVGLGLTFPTSLSPTPIGNVRTVGRTGLIGKVDPESRSVWQPCL
ncbi:MAG TPA: hypothetical protein PKE21_14560 [Flavobacteriales bacterium]|nr:hypothetical protein [Flavobacteriales bacterium]HMR28702.1 hypothetical protein [Flavobacteriales bacterium]